MINLIMGCLGIWIGLWVYPTQPMAGTITALLGVMNLLLAAWCFEIDTWED
jgi:hypothetical protein